jgi:hypothetical protein
MEEKIWVAWQDFNSKWHVDSFKAKKQKNGCYKLSKRHLAFKYLLIVSIGSSTRGEAIQVAVKSEKAEIKRHLMLIELLNSNIEKLNEL